MDAVDFSVRKLNRTFSLMDKPCERGCLAKKIVIRTKNIILALPRLLTRTRASSKQVRRLVKYYLFYAKPADRTAEKTRIIEALYDRLAQLKRKDGTTYAHGIARNAFEEVAKGRLDPHKCFVKLKSLKAASPRVLFNLTANQFGQGSPLSTSPHLPMLEYVHSYLEALQKQTGRHPVDSSVMKQISQAVTLMKERNFVKCGMGQAAQALAKKERLLIPGGWRGDPVNQPYYYEVIPQANGKVSFRVYNLGSGAEHNGIAIEDVKTKTTPYAEWRGIDEAKIKNPAFWQIIEEMVVKKESLTSLLDQQVNSEGGSKDSKNGPVAYGPNHVYHGLRKFLNPKEPDAEVKADSIFMSPQEGGVHKALNGFLRTHMSAPDYRRLITSIRLQALVDKVHKVGLTKPKWWHRLIDWLPQKLAKVIRMRLDLMITPEAEAQLIEKSRDKLSQKITRAYDDGVIGKDFLLRARGLMEKISVVVDKNRLERMRVKPCSENWGFHAIGKKLAEPLADLSKPLHQTLLNRATGSTKPMENVAVAIRKLAAADKAQLAETVRQVRQISEKAWKEGDDRALNAGLMQFVRELPIDSKDWNDVCQKNPEKAKAMIADLGVVTKTLFNTFLKLPQAQRMNAERTFVLRKLHHIQAALLATVDPELAKKFRADVSISDNSFFTLYDSKMQHEWGEIHRSYNYSGSFADGTGIRTGSENSISVFFSERRHAGAPHIPNFWETLQNQIPASSLIPPKAQAAPAFARTAHLFASEKLPDWVKGIRDTYLCEAYYSSAHMPMGALENCDRTKGFDFNLNVEASGKESASVNITLKGVNETISFHADNKEKREYRSMHRTVKPGTLIHDLFKEMQNLSMLEKKLLGAGHTEELTELLHLFLKQETKGLVKLMGYFNKHPQLLEELDYQILFDMCFKYGVIKASKDEFSDLAQTLGQFFSSHYTSLVDQHKIQPAVTLLQTMRRFATFFPDEPSLQGTTAKVKALLKRQGLEPEQKSCIYAELLAIYGSKKTLTSDEAIDLLVGHVQLTESALPAKWRDPVMDDAIASAVHLHADSVRNALVKGNGEPNQEALNAIFSQLRPGSAQKWKLINPAQLTFATADERIHFIPMFGQLVTPGTVIQLPAQIRQNVEFNRLFPQIDKAEIYPGGFRFLDSQRRETLARIEGETLVLEQKLKVGNKEEWCQLVSSSQLLSKQSVQNLIERILSAVIEFFIKKWPALQNSFLPQLWEVLKGEPFFESALGSRHLVNQYSFWRSHSDPKRLYGVDIKSGKQDVELLYGNGRFSSVKRSDGTILGAGSKAFAAFEVPEYVQQWYHPTGKMAGMLAKVELPRFGLTFTPVNGNAKLLACDQYKGYRLALGVTIPQLGSYHHYLVLKNDKGQQKVLIPRCGFKEIDPLSKEFSDALKPAYELNRRLAEGDTGPLEYYTFDVAGDALNSPDRTGNIYVATALTHAGEYRQAYAFLKKYGPKLSAYSQKEKESLLQLIYSQTVTKNSEVAANALRSYAGFLYVKNSLDHHIELQEKEKMDVQNLYQNYLKSHRSSPIAPFTSDEELFMVYFGLLEQKSEQSNPILIRRLFELQNDPQKVEEYKEYKKQQFKQSQQKKETVAPVDTQPKKELFSLWGDFPTSFYDKKSVAELRKKSKLTSPNEILRSNFATLAGIAKQGNSSDKDWLKTMLCFVIPEQAESKDTAATMSPDRKRALALSYMLECPDQFSLHPGVTHGEKVEWEIVERWNKETADKLNKLVESRPMKPVVPPKQPLIYLPPARFQFERPVPAIAPNAILLSFKTPPSWKNECSQKLLFGTKQVSSPNLCKPFTEWLDRQKGVGLDVPEYEGLRKAQKSYAAQNTTMNQYTLGKGGIQAIEAALAANKSQALEMARLKRSIEAIVNRPPAIASEKALRDFHLWSGRQRPITVDEVIIAFGQKNPQALLRLNAALDPQAVNQLFNQVGSYLLMTSHEQQRIRALATLESYKAAVKRKDLLEQEALLQQLGIDLNTERCYDPAKNPEYLVFEHYVQILIRKEQFDILKLYFESGDFNIVKELIMGWGKSSVIVPLLGILRAKPGVLSLLIVPPQLLEDVASKTQGVHRDAYGKQLHGLKFDRDSIFTVESLHMIQFDLKNIVKNQECLIMTSRSIQCLLLKCLELVNTCKHQQNLSREDQEKMVLLREILTMLKTTGHPLIDEIDSVLDVMLRLVFSFGKKEPPNREDCELVAHLYTVLLTSPELKKLGKVECDVNSQASAPVMTEALYDQSVRAPLAAAMLDHLKTASFSTSGLTDKSQRFFQGLAANDRRLALNYVTRRGDLREAQAFYDGQDKDIKNILALLGEEISNMLKRTLTRPCNQKYGVDTESKSPLAIPFIAASQPRRGSQFANPVVTMNYTLQLYLKEGVSRKAVKKVVKNLQVKANRQSKEEGLPLDQTDGWKTFKKLCGDLDMPSLNLKPAHITALHARVNGSFALKRDFVLQGILPLIDVFEGILSCNSHNFISFFDHGCGVTATLGNADSMHRKLKTFPDQEIPVKMLNLLWEKSFSRVHVIREGTPEEMFKQMLAKNPCDMVVDSGGYFKVKEGNDLPIARTFAALSGKPVLFKNNDDCEEIVDGTGNSLNSSTIALDERKVFLAERFGVGANVKVKRQATGSVTIGRDTTLSKFLQNCGRFYRELNRSQTLEFFILDEVESIIRQVVKKPDNVPLTLADILVFLVRNQSTYKGRDNFVALKQELTDVKQQILIDAMLKVNEFRDLLPVVDDLLGSWYKTSARQPADLYGSLPIEEASGVIAERKRAEATAELTALINKHAILRTKLGWTAAKAKTTVDEIVDRMKSRLPPMLIDRPGNSLGQDDDDQAVEVETETEVETEIAKQVEVNRNPVKLGTTHDCTTPIADLNDPNLLKRGGYFDLALYMSSQDELMPYAAAFKGIDITTNGFAWPEKATSAYEMKLFGPQRTPLHFVRVTGDDVCILSDDDNPQNTVVYGLGVDAFYKKGRSSSPHDILMKKQEVERIARFKENLKEILREIAQYGPIGFQSSKQFYEKEIADWEAKEAVNKKVEEITQPGKFQPSEAFRKVVKIKFLNGDCEYTLAEQKVLKDWFQQQGPQGAARMQELYLKHILKGFPAKSQAFRGSALERVFRAR